LEINDLEYADEYADLLKVQRKLKKDVDKWNKRLKEEELDTDIKLQRCNENHMVKVDRKIFKPFWFGRHMYLVDIRIGELWNQTPIYLGNRAYATLSDLINYFHNNNIEIIYHEDVIKVNTK